MTRTAMRYITGYLLICIALFSTTIQANDATTPAATDITATDAWTRETPPGVSTTAIYLTLKNKTAKAVRLIAVASDSSDRLELHTHKMQDGMMKMQQIEAITIPAGAEIALMPHGDHIMVFNLDVALKEGEVVSVELSFDNGQILSVDAPVHKQPPGAMQTHNKPMAKVKSHNH